MSLWYTETFNDRVRFGLRVTETLFRRRSDYQLIEIFKTEELGTTLAIDGLYMTSVGDEFFYHEMLVHPAMVTAPCIEHVLIIGGGDGGTAREVLRHPGVKKLTMVEIDSMVIEACKKHLPDGFGAWEDPRLEVIIGDGINYLADAAPETFDVVLLDGTDPVGPAKGLFGRDFYKNTRRALRPDGVFALQSESPMFMGDIFMDIQETLSKEFDAVHPYFGPVPLYGCGLWSWTYATKGVDPMAIVESRVEPIEAVAKQYNRDVHRGAFAIPNRFRGKIGTPR